MGSEHKRFPRVNPAEPPSYNSGHPVSQWSPADHRRQAEYILEDVYNREHRAFRTENLLLGVIHAILSKV